MTGIFTGPHQLYLGYKLSTLTKVFLYVMYPVAKPLALLLDYLVEGEVKEDGTPSGGGETYHRGELSALVRIQYEDSHSSTKPIRKRVNRHRRDDSWFATKQEIIEKANEIGVDDPKEEEQDPQEQLAPPLDPTEVDLIEGALQMKTVLVMDVYTPLTHVYGISADALLDKKGFTEIYSKGFSRVPVHQPNPEDEDDKTHILGFLLIKQLILIDWDHKREVSTLPLQRPKCVSPRMNLVDALRILRSEGHLMVFVCARPDLANKALAAEKEIPPEGGFMGVVTLEDIMESLLQERIYDEWDMKDRDRAVATLQRWAVDKLQHFVRKKAKALREKRTRLAKTQNHWETIDDSAKDFGETAPLIHHHHKGGISPTLVGYKAI